MRFAVPLVDRNCPALYDDEVTAHKAAVLPP